MSRRVVSRRQFLHGLGGAAVALPFMSSLMPRVARAAGAPPKRFIIMFTPNGFMHSQWPGLNGLPVATPLVDLLNSSCLKPLAPHVDKTVVMRGLEMGACATGTNFRDPAPSEEHYYLADRMLTGASPVGGVAAKSIDNYIAQAIGSSCRFGFRHHGIISEGGISTTGSTTIPAQPNPQAFFDDLVSNMPAMSSGGDPEPAPVIDFARQRRASVLDYVRGSISDVQCRVGADDRRVLEAHLDSIRDLEVRLGSSTPTTNPTPLSSSCEPPLDPHFDRGGVTIDMPLVSRMHIDLLAMEMACDLTRVGSLQYRIPSAGNTVYSWVPEMQEWAAREHHNEITHASTHDSWAAIGKILKWYAGELAYLAQRLDGYIEADGSTLLDNTIIWWTSEIGLYGNNHGWRNLGTVLVGKGGGALRTGQYLNVGAPMDKQYLAPWEPEAFCSPSTVVSPNNQGDRHVCEGGNRYTPGLPHNNLLREIYNACVPDAPVAAFPPHNPDPTMNAAGGIPQLRA